MIVSYGEVKIAKLRLDGEELKMITGKKCVCLVSSARCHG
jgi:hypothetical protein